MCNFTTTFQPCVEFPALVGDEVGACADEDVEAGVLLVLEENDEVVTLPVLVGEEEAVND